MNARDGALLAVGAGGPAAAADAPGGGAPPLVALRRATVRHGATPALRGVDFALPRGDFVAVVGANGAGKTTLLRAMHGLAPLADGSRDAAPAVRIAMLFQRPFLVRTSVRANVELAPWLAGVPRAQRRALAEQALQRVGLAGLALRPARELSVGQQQRVALARAWAFEPDVLLLDEPTASLDPAAAREVEALITQIAERGAAVVLVSHHLGQVRRLARRVVLLEQGQVAADLPAPRFFDGPHPAAVAGFLRAELP